MADKKTPEELGEDDLAAVQGGADAPIAASRFGISIDGVQSDGGSQLLGHELTHVQQQSGDKQTETSSKIVTSGGGSDI